MQVLNIEAKSRKKNTQSSIISETATLLGVKLCNQVFIFSPKLVIAV